MDEIRAQKPEHINLLETLNVFGVRAQFMQQFKEYLEEEGLPPNDDRIGVPRLLMVREQLTARTLDEAVAMADLETLARIYARIARAALKDPAIAD